MHNIPFLINLFLPATAASAEAATASSKAATTATAAEASTATATAATFTTAAEATTTTSATSEEVHAIADVEHGIASNGIDLLIAPAIGIDGTREVGLLVQNVIPLQHDGE